MNDLVKNELKLEFIEEGRLTFGEMGEIIGGGDGICWTVTSCGTKTPCAPGQTGLNSCHNYKICDSPFNKSVCDLRQWTYE